MICALCNRKGRFPKSGNLGTRKIYRCPACKYDQTKSVFGEGQYISGRGPAPVLDTPVEASWEKIRFYGQLKTRLPREHLDEGFCKELFPVPSCPQQLAQVVREHLVGLGLDEDGARIMFDDPPEWLQTEIAEVNAAFERHWEQG